MKKIFLFAAVTIALAACNSDDNYVEEPVAAQISATIGKSDVSRASETSWAPGDNIGITMDGRYVNRQYTTIAGDGVFTGTTMYFKNKTESVNLTAYYPFAGTEGTAPVLEASTTAENQTPENRTGFDYLYATVTTTGATPAVSFNFAHKMSKLTLIFKNGSGMDVSKITSYEINGLILDGTFDTKTGVCAVKNTDAKPLVISTTDVKNEVALPSLIIFPQDNVTLTLKIKDNENQEYACNLSFRDNDNRILTGNNYQWTITVNKTGLTVNKSTIIDWNKEELTGGAESDLSDLSPEP